MSTEQVTRDKNGGREGVEHSAVLGLVNLRWSAGVRVRGGADRETAVTVYKYSI